MTRHPSTEGNDLRPRHVDATDDVQVGGFSVADAASGVFIQASEPEDPPDGARWTDTIETPPKTFIYDDSTDIWLPINAGDRTFVSETEPDSEELLKGDMWFNTDPDDDDLAQEIYYFDGDALVWLGDLPEIPNSVVDNFEDDDAEPTAGPYGDGEDISDYYNRDTGGYSRVSGGLGSGDFALEHTGEEDDIVSEPGDGLPNYPEPGDKMRLLIRESSDRSVPHFLFSGNINGSFDGYSVDFNPDTVSLGRIDDFSDGDAIFNRKTELDSESDSDITTETTFWVEIDTPSESGDDEGDIEVRVYHYNDSDDEAGDLILTLSANDTNHQGGRGIGFATGSATGAQWDDLFTE